MANYDGIPLQLQDEQPAHGLALRLDTASPVSLIKQIDGWEVEMREGSHVVVAREPCSTSRTALADEALEAIQRALDEIAVHARHPPTTPGCHHNWTRFDSENGRRVLDIAVTVTVPVAAFATLTVADRHGKEVSPPAPSPVTWHESLRFYRMFRASTNLYEAGRNLALALESILSKTHPHSGYGDSGWFRSALTTANLRYGLASLPGAPHDIVRHLMSAHYTGVRCELMHAKDGRDYYLPSKADARGRLEERLEFVEAVFLKIAEGELGVRGGGGGLTPVAIADIANLYRSCKATMCDAWWKSDQAISPKDLQGSSGQQVPVADSQASDLTISIKACFLPTVETVGCFGIVGPGGFVTPLPGRLNTNGLHEIWYNPRVVFLNFGDRAYYT